MRAYTSETKSNCYMKHWYWFTSNDSLQTLLTWDRVQKISPTQYHRPLRSHWHISNRPLHKPGLGEVLMVTSISHVQYTPQQFEKVIKMFALVHTHLRDTVHIFFINHSMLRSDVSTSKSSLRFQYVQGNTSLSPAFVSLATDFKCLVSSCTMRWERS